MIEREYRLWVELEDEDDLVALQGKLRAALDFWCPDWSMIEVDE